MANLKFYLNTFLKKLFNDESLEIRLRPGYFPFVEPGVEIDLRCFKCKGDGCTTCKGTGWIEVLGAGMVHPNVLNQMGINNRKYTGFAFGMGVDRLAMLKYGIDDVRYFYNGDLRVVNQF
jgi:phenylalanyl-tRNA synthetase alpha chain